MKVLEKLNHFPDQNKLKKLLLLSIILFFISFFLVNYFFEISNYPVPFYESQLSFNADAIKSHLAVMTNEEINIYRNAQMIDYFYMISYGLVIFTSSIFLARKCENIKIRNLGFLIAIFGITAIFCDGIENIFIFLMIANPINFPDIYAVIHSCFALIKFLMMGVYFIWLLPIIIYLTYNKFKSNK